MAFAVVGAATSILSAAIAAGEALAKLIPTYRQCTIWIENASRNYTLCNPSHFIKSGRCKEPPTPVIISSDIGGGVYAKTDNAARGTVAIITYNLQRKDTRQTTKMAVMFSVPYDFNLYSNWYAVGIFDKNTLCNNDLYNKMYYECGPFTRGKAGDGQITYKGRDVTMIATMSDVYTPVIKLQIFD